MARHFDGVDDHVTLSAGATGLLARGALTYLAYVRLASNHRGGLYEALEGGLRRTGANPFDNGKIFFAVNGSVGWGTWDYSTFLNEWVIVGWSKPSGNGATVTGHLWQGGTWDHEALGTVDAAAGSTIDSIVSGRFGSDFLHGDKAVEALYASNLSSAAIEAAGLPTSLAGWLDLTPAAAWKYNQADLGGSTFDPVVDLTAGAADQTAITGTSVSTDPPGFSYSLGSTGTLDLAAAAATMTAAGVASSSASLGAVATAATLALAGTSQAQALLAATASAATLSAAGTAQSTAVLTATAAAATLTMRDNAGTVVHPPRIGTITRPDTGVIAVPRLAYP